MGTRERDGLIVEGCQRPVEKKLQIFLDFEVERFD